MVEVINELGDFMIFVILGTVFIVGMVLKTFAGIISGVSRERSRREIAAYIAEGSMTPEQGEKLMKADLESDRKA